MVCAGCVRSASREAELLGHMLAAQAPVIAAMREKQQPIRGAASATPRLATAKSLKSALDCGFQASFVRNLIIPSQVGVCCQQNPKEPLLLLDNIGAYLREMNVSERLGSDMLATPPERVHMLTLAELKAYGLMGVDPAEQRRRAIQNEAWEVDEATRLGIDRREYIRRKALGDGVCRSATDDSDYLNCKQRVLETGR
jgi:hypothetical protein